MYSSILIFTTMLLFLLATVSNGKKCVRLYGQCGGNSYEGPTCCVEPTPLPGYVNSITRGSNICVEVSPYYSQCQRRCTEEKPCLQLGTSKCYASLNGVTDGRGRQYCGVTTACTNPAWCFSDPISCVCGGDVPCALSSRPGGCRAPQPDVYVPGRHCGLGARRCPAFEGEQCGGVGHTTPTSCQTGLKCVKYGEYFSGCAKV